MHGTGEEPVQDGAWAGGALVDDVFDASLRQMDVDKPGRECPSCDAADQPVHDTRRRSWVHLRFFEHKAFIHAAVPRVACSQSGKTRQVTVPAAGRAAAPQSLRDRAGARPVTAVADLWTWATTVWGARPPCPGSPGSEDGRSRPWGSTDGGRRGHEYITLFHDLRAGRLLFACEGRDAGAVETFAEDLRAPGGDPDAISAAIPAACIAGVGRHLPRARRPGAPRCAVSRR